MNKVGRSGELYIHFHNNRWNVTKHLDGKQYYFGCFKTLEEAKAHRDYCIANGWSMSCKYDKRKPRPTGYQHIQQVKYNGKYRVVKRINGDYIYYGTFDTLEEAKAHRDYCADNNWSNECRVLTRKKHNLPKYITKSARGYLLQKNSKATGLYQQWFSRLEDAVKERDLLIKVNWDELKLIELDEIEGTL